MPDLLIELFSEEIPARMQAKAAADLRRLVTDGLVEAGLTYAGAGAEATPRRLALHVEGLLAESPRRVEERKGPKVDAPEKAVEGFLRGAGVSRDDLEARETPKGAVWFARIETPGRAAGEIVAEVLGSTIRDFPWPKSMRWGSGSLRWVRPLHGIVCVLSDEAGAEVVPVEVDGIVSGAVTAGHRFMAPGEFSVTNFDDYEAKLKRAKVVLRSEERAGTIRAELSAQAFARGLTLVEDEALLAEVAGLVEWPVVLLGEIDTAFLGLPAEVLRTSMKEHQKFFSLKGADGRITHFATVANIEAPDDGATILAGNRKVLAARLSDAKFFWENDLATVERGGMIGMAAPLANVTFHAKLGTQAERVERIAALAREIAPAVGAKPDLAEEAARVAKADLASEMVYEFPELQGVMGRYYAAAAGHDDGVPEACEEHYRPVGPSDAVPTAPVSVAVALADKIDMLTGFWAIDEKPTGSKDPYALRRAALGVIRLVLENRVRVEMSRLLLRHSLAQGILLQGRHFKELGANLGAFTEGLPSESRESFHNALLKFVDAVSVEFEEAVWVESNTNVSDLLTFFHDRLKVHLRDEGIRHDVIDAVLAMPGADDLVLVEKRARALNAFLATDDGENLVQGFRRANNILAQAEARDGVEYSYGGDVKFAETDEERALFAALETARAEIAPAMAAEDFEAAMHAMARLRAPIDAFFEAVQVNAEAEVVRRNRLNLLHEIREICGQVADLTRLEG